MLRQMMARVFAIGLVFASAGAVHAFMPEFDDVTWRVVEIDGQPVEDAGSLIFKGDRVSGATACNRIAGGWKTTDKEGYAFGPLAGTRMMCDEGKMAKEQKLLKALERMQAYKHDGAVLLLLDGSGKPVVKLQK